LGICNFFGDDKWQYSGEADDLLDCYIEKIRTETSRKLVISLPVIGKGSHRYDIILATRVTRGGSPWIKAMKKLQENMGSYKPKLIRNILDYLMHRQSSVDDFCKLDSSWVVTTRLLNTCHLTEKFLPCHPNILQNR